MICLHKGVCVGVCVRVWVCACVRVCVLKFSNNLILVFSSTTVNELTVALLRTILLCAFGRLLDHP